MVFIIEMFYKQLSERCHVGMSQRVIFMIIRLVTMNECQQVCVLWSTFFNVIEPRRARLYVKFEKDFF
jgi:hypothetical protein